MTVWILAVLVLASAAVAARGAEAGDDTPAGPLSFMLTANDGKPYPLKQHRGKVMLLVNTASQCGLTPQYAELQALHEQKQAQGLVIIAIPANEFGAQEPGTDAQIREFCTTRFKVGFPLMQKTVVKGAGIDPLYHWLTNVSDQKGEIAWNFTKFLVGRDGKLIARFEPKVKPSDPEVTKAIDAALAAKP